MLGIFVEGGAMISIKIVPRRVSSVTCDSCVLGFGRIAVRPGAYFVELMVSCALVRLTEYAAAGSDAEPGPSPCAVLCPARL